MQQHHKIVITIGRQFGSGGRAVGMRLAELMGIGYYDKELMSEAARKSGLSQEYFEKSDERAPDSMSHISSLGFLAGGINFWFEGSLSGENIFKYQSDVILSLAAEQSCVIVGRCADYILRENPSCYSVFIHAPLEQRVERVMQSENVSKRVAVDTINKKDKSRAAYYNFYTDRTWGDSATYKLSIDSSVLDIEGTALSIRDFIHRALAKKE